MNDNRYIEIEEARNVAVRWEAKLRRLKEALGGGDDEARRGYFNTLDELHLYLDQFRREVERAERTEKSNQTFARTRLDEKYDEISRLFDAKLATIRHQKF